MDPNRINEDRDTGLHLAIKAKNFELTKILLHDIVSKENSMSKYTLK